MERPRLLLVPMLTEVEWAISPLLEEWADIATYDAPGIGDEPPVEDLTSTAVGQRGLEEADRRGWDRFVVVADEFGVAAATELVAIAGDRVEAVALGHARLSNSEEGERPVVNGEVLHACRALISADARTFVLQMFKMTGGEDVAGGYQEEMAAEFMRRVPAELMNPFYDSRTAEGTRIGERLRSLDVPMLLAEHRGCLMFTREGFDDAVAALSGARTATIREKPSTSPEFAAVLREFCTTLATAPV